VHLLACLAEEAEEPTNWLVGMRTIPSCGVHDDQILQAGASQSEIHRRSVSAYGRKVFSREEVPVCCHKPKDGRTALNDAPKKQRQTEELAH
jgi:hypothetical protein